MNDTDGDALSTRPRVGETESAQPSGRIGRMWIGLLLPSSGTSAVSVTVASKPHASWRLPPAPTDESPHDDDGGRSATSDAASSNPRQSAERSTTTAVAVVRRGIADRE